MLLLFSCSPLSDSLWPHGLQHTVFPATISTRLLKSRSIESVMSSNHLILCYLLLLQSQSFPVSGSFITSRLFASGGLSVGASAASSVLPMNIQGWFSLGFTGLISLQSKEEPPVYQPLQSSYGTNFILSEEQPPVYQSLMSSYRMSFILSKAPWAALIGAL